MRYMLFLFFFVIANTDYALTLNPNAPTRYVVQQGDTLWDIANRYLTYPWEWKQLWRANPQIKNPNRLHPGAILELHYYQRNPYLKVLSNGTIKLSPHLRPMALEDAIPPIPLADIRPFLDASLVLEKDSLKDAPFVIAFTTEHMLGGQGDEVYVKNLCPPLPPRGTTFSYAIYRPKGEYIDPVLKSGLGYKATLVGYAELVRGCDPSTIVLTDILQGVELEDRVMPNNHPDFDLSFLPKTPVTQVNGYIIDLPGDYTQGAVGLVVVLNRGKDAHLQPGDVLGVYSKAKAMRNPICPGCVALPEERIGEVMVFRTFKQTSFALVMRSIRAIQILDKVTNP